VVPSHVSRTADGCLRSIPLIPTVAVTAVAVAACGGAITVRRRAHPVEGLLPTLWDDPTIELEDD
jgi:hypothetical protein